MNLKNVYNNALYERYNYPKYKVILQEYNAESGVYNPSCGDRVSIQAMVKDDRLTAVGYQAEGCVISGGSADVLLEYVLGKTVADVMAITKEQVLEVIGMQLGPNRLRCALITLEALQNACKQYQDRGF